MYLSSALAAGNQPPNILLIAVDDMGYDTPVSFGGRVEGLTPHIDTLASHCVRANSGDSDTASSMPPRTSVPIHTCTSSSVIVPPVIQARRRRARDGANARRRFKPW